MTALCDRSDESTSPADELGPDEPELCCGGLPDCNDEAVEIVDMARLSGEDDVPALAMCAYHARITREYWARMAAEERI